MRPFVIVSCAMSLDGYLDDSSDRRLILSGPADLDRVDALRASCDAILVGAGTIRADNPRLLVRSAARRAARLAAGEPETPLKVTVTTSGNLDPAAAFFTAGAGTSATPPLVFVPAARRAAVAGHLGAVASVVVADDVAALLADLDHRGVRRLLVEGGTAVLTAMLAAGVVDELWLAVAPLLLGATGGARFAGPGMFPPGRWRLVTAEAAGDVAVLRYGPPDG